MKVEAGDAAKLRGHWAFSYVAEKVRAIATSALLSRHRNPDLLLQTLGIPKRDVVLEVGGLRRHVNGKYSRDEIEKMLASANLAIEDEIDRRIPVSP